jgi:hypothetical protein
MEEVFLLLVVVRDESEAFVAHNAFDRSTRHPLLLTFRRWPVSSEQSLPGCTNTTAVPFIFCAGEQWTDNSTPQHRIRIVLMYGISRRPEHIPVNSFLINPQLQSSFRYAHPLDPRFAAVLARHVLRRVLATVRGAHHGGMLVVVPERDASEILSDGRHVRLKYPFVREEPRRRLRSLTATTLTNLPWRTRHFLNATTQGGVSTK